MTDLMELVTTIPAGPNELGNAVKVVLEALEGKANRDAPEAARLVVDELVTRLLDWMGTGDVESVRSLLASIRAAQPADPLASLSPTDRFRARLAVVETITETYLRSNNLSRHLGVLAGARRVAWGFALGKVCAAERPFTAHDLTATSPIPRSTAHNILRQLAEHGLLERVGDEGAQALYSPTWAGRDAFRAWKALGQGKAASVEESRRTKPSAGPGFTVPSAELLARVKEAVAEAVEQSLAREQLAGEVENAELAEDDGASRADCESHGFLLEEAPAGSTISVPSFAERMGGRGHTRSAERGVAAAKGMAGDDRGRGSGWAHAPSADRGTVSADIAEGVAFPGNYRDRALQAPASEHRPADRRATAQSTERRARRETNRPGDVSEQVPETSSS